MQIWEKDRCLITSDECASQSFLSKTVNSWELQLNVLSCLYIIAHLILLKQVLLQIIWNHHSVNCVKTFDEHLSVFQIKHKNWLTCFEYNKSVNKRWLPERQVGSISHRDNKTRPACCSHHDRKKRTWWWIKQPIWVIVLCLHSAVWVLTTAPREERRRSWLQPHVWKA